MTNHRYILNLLKSESRVERISQLCSLLAFCALGPLSLTCAFANSAVDESLLGLSEQAFQESMPEVSKVLKPNWGPHGVRGLFTLNKVNLHGQNFDVVFYFKNKRLARIEHRRVPIDGKCESDFNVLISTLNLKYGVGTGSADASQSVNSGTSFAWKGESFTASAYKLVDKKRCEFLVALEPRYDIDASTL